MDPFAKTGKSQDFSFYPQNYRNTLSLLLSFSFSVFVYFVFKFKNYTECLLQTRLLFDTRASPPLPSPIANSITYSDSKDRFRYTIC